MTIFCPEFFPDYADCVVGLARPSLIEILDIEPTKAKFVFCALFGGSWLLSYLSIYVARTVFLLAVVEDEGEAVKRHRTTPSGDAVAIDLEDDLEDDMQRLDGHHGDSLQHRLLFRRSEIEYQPRLLAVLVMLRHGVYSSLKTSFCFLQNILSSPLTQQNLITRNLATTIRQLRYCSGTSSFLFRALPVYIMCWLVVPRALPFLLGSIWLFLEGFGRLMFRFIAGKPSNPAHFTTWPIMGIARVIWYMFLQDLLAFHTLRVLSASTGFSTNFVAEYIRDPRLLRPSESYRAKYSHGFIVHGMDRASWFHLLYGFCETLPSLTYYFMTRDLDISRDFYYTNHRRSGNFLLSDPSTRQVLSNAIFIWLFFSGIALCSLSVIVRIHATYLDDKQPTVVDFCRVQRLPFRLRQPSSRHRIFRWAYKFWSELAAWTLPPGHLTRVIRILFQLLLLISAEALVVFLAMRYLVRTLHNGDLFADWLARSYLEPDASLTPSGVVWNLFFWHQQVIWAYSPGYPRRGTEFAFSNPNARPNV